MGKPATSLRLTDDPEGVVRIILRAHGAREREIEETAVRQAAEAAGNGS